MTAPDLEDIQRIGVVGSGTMGAGIAQVAAQRGYDVLLYDIEQEIVANALETIAHYIHRAAEKGKISEDEARTAVARIQTTTDLGGFSLVDFVIEAAPERIELKQQIFEKLDEVTRRDVALATNTSTLSITEIGSATGRPAQVVGMHFFNPAPLMPLVEVIAGAETDDVVLDLTVALAEALGKSPVRVQDVPGFIVNRVARPFYLEALRMLEQGVADHATLDRLIREGGGFRMGPFELMDLIGIDINYHASKSVYDAFFHQPRFRPSVLQQRKAASGRLGRKTGSGWYDYEEES